jgi:hypothetical protein
MTPADQNPYDPAQRYSGPPDQHGVGHWNPYESNWTDTGPVIGQTQTVSALAILSMISGIISIPFMCMCFLSIPFSLFAIVSGHIARGICRRSEGRVTGQGMAIAGLALGYVSLTILLGMLAFFFAARSTTPFTVPGPPNIAPQWTDASDGEEALDNAIEGVSLKSSQGNSEAAVQIAMHLQDSLHDIAQQMQAGTSSSANTTVDANTNGETEPAAESTTVIAELPETSEDSELQRALQDAAVYCHLKSDSCAFLVEIGNLSELNDADRITLSQMIWLAAGRSADDLVNVGQRFAVVLVDENELQEISLGTHERSDRYDVGLEQRGPASYETRLQLESFFQPEPISSDVEATTEGANDFMLEVPAESTPE